MTTIVYGKVGYVEESTYGLRSVPTEFRRFGNELQDQQIPKEKTNPLIKLLSSSFLPSTLKYDDVTVEWSFSYQLIDGKELSYIDDSITTGDTTTGDPRYRHHVAPVIPSAAYTLPSRTVHIELFDEDDNFVTALDCCGGLIKTTEGKHIAGDANGLVITDTFIFQRITDDAPTSTLLGETSGATADPEGAQGQYYANSIADANQGSAASDSGTDSLTFDFRAGTGYGTASDPFHIDKSASNMVNIGGTIQLTTNTAETYGTVTAGGTDLTSYYKSFGYKIDFVYSESRPQRSGYNNYGASIKPYLMNALIESVNISTTLQLDTDDAMLNLQLDGFKKTRSNTIYVRVSKFNDSTDWIAFCFAPTSGTAQNLQVDLEGMVSPVADLDYYTFNYICKDLNIVVGNASATLRALT